MPLRNQIKKAINQAEGSVFIVKKSLTSSDIDTAAVDLTGVAEVGDVLVEKVILSTDSTGLAGGTNFAIQVNGETYGINQPIVEAVSNLGGNQQRSAPHAAATGDTSNDYHITITAALPFVLQAGDKLQHICTAATCTGSGKILVTLVCRRLKQGAKLEAV